MNMGSRDISKLMDTVVLACGSIPNTAVFESLKGIAPEIHIAGDCAKARTILGAMDGAARISRLISIEESKKASQRVNLDSLYSRRGRWKRR